MRENRVKDSNSIGYRRGARQTMYYMNQDAVDYFRVDFTPCESIVGGKHYPLGTFAVEMMECVMQPSMLQPSATKLSRISADFAI